MNENEMSLMTILRTTNSDLAERLKRLTVEVKQDKENLSEASQEYSNKYKDEIEEGTKKRQNFLTEGKNRGMSDEEAEKYAYRGGFMPTVYTPILNMLYFLLRETDDIDRELNQKRKEYDQRYGHLVDNTILSENITPPPDMATYLYGNITLDTFDKLKKLKALTQSPNEQESFLAYRKCLELCKKFGLEFEKIPCYCTKQQKIIK